MKTLVVMMILLILIPTTRSTNSQNMKLGFSIEPSFLFFENRNESSISFTPFSAGLKFLARPLNWLEFEARPGIFIGGQDFRWIELGGYARFNLLPTKYYIIAGVNDHIKGGYDDLLFNGAGIGFQKDSRLSFDMIFYWKNGVKEDKLNGILKICVSFAWDIL